jgi:hypothetical protein
MFEGCKIQSGNNAKVISASPECKIEIGEGILIDIIDRTISKDDLRTICKSFGE